jgi:hypothetical protein
LVPWFIGKVEGFVNQYISNMDLLCDMCKLMRVQGLTIPECQGYDAWGYQNLCTVVNVTMGDKY